MRGSRSRLCRISLLSGDVSRVGWLGQRIVRSSRVRRSPAPSCRPRRPVKPSPTLSRPAANWASPGRVPAFSDPGCSRRLRLQRLCHAEQQTGSAYETICPRWMSGRTGTRHAQFRRLWRLRLLRRCDVAELSELWLRHGRRLDIYRDVCERERGLAGATRRSARPTLPGPGTLGRLCDTPHPGSVQRWTVFLQANASARGLRYSVQPVTTNALPRHRNRNLFGEPSPGRL